MSANKPASLRAAVPGLRRTLRRFSPYLRAQRRLLAGGSVALLLEVVFRLLEPWPLKFVLDRVIAEGTGADLTGGLDAGTLLLLCAVGVVAAVGLRALASYLSTIAFAIAGNRVLTEVRAEVYHHLQRLSLRYHARARTGDLVTRVTGDVGRLQEVAVTAALPLVGNVVTFTGMLVVMLVLDWQLTLLVALTFPFFCLTMVRLTTRIRTVARKQRTVEGALASVASEAFSSMKLVQSYSLERVLEERFASGNAKSLKQGVQAKRLAAGLERRTDLLVGLATGVVLLLGGQRVLRGALSPGDLVVFVTYLKNAFKPMRDLAKYAGRLAKASASGERLVDVLDTRAEVEDSPYARRAPRLRGDVRLEGVTFSYEPGTAVLRGVDLRARPGQRVALVGPSGAGKSSIASLILRLYDPDTGVVLLDGVDVRDYTVDSVRGQMAVVLQDSLLFAGTIRENIAHGAPGASDAAIAAAARLAHADEFVSALPDGYDTIVGERGATLSGGQRQRIAIARAAVRDAPLVLLDEPLTGLDRESEERVAAALANLAEGRTTITVTHDLHAARHADLIVHMEDGAVAEQGTHAALVARDGAYAEMWRRAEAARSVRSVEEQGDAEGEAATVAVGGATVGAVPVEAAEEPAARILDLDREQTAPPGPPRATPPARRSRRRRARAA